MHIVHVITRLIVGGAQENTLLSCEGQHDRGHRVTLITGPSPGPEGSLMGRAAGHGYAVETIDDMVRAVNPWRDGRAYRTLVRRLRDLRPDVVHTHSSKAGILGRWAARAAGVPTIVHTIHGLAFTASTNRAINATYRWLERRAAPVTDTIVCVAGAMAEQSLAARIGRPDQYVTVHSGMDTAAFLNPPVPRAAARAALGFTDNDVVAGTIARLFHMKGHDDLLDLAPALCARFPLLKFLWVGDGLLRRRFEERIKELNLSDRFVLTGLVPPARIAELAGAMDVLVHPSRREGLARALPQGSLAGCPVVTYAIDGNAEALVQGETGWAVPPFDVAVLGDRLASVVADANLRRRMGAAGRAFVVERFDTRVMIDGLEKVYQRWKVDG